jgi:hypothetical protein
MQYDVLLSGGRVIDPAQDIDGTLDVAIQDGRVAAVQAAIPRDSAKEVLDVCPVNSCCLVSSTPTPTCIITSLAASALTPTWWVCTQGSRP